ncbi:MAG: hypothetical protein IT381_13740 [Deltaproteobacteria bacterium]|nr:hypothetical protein [Deltaproteobacteria bacterium]
MLSPSEIVGLRGKTIDAQLRRAASLISNSAARRMEARLRADALANHVVYDRDGQTEPVRILARPLAATADQLSYVHHVCEVINDALRRLPDLYLQDADVRRVLPLDAREEQRLRSFWSARHGAQNPIYGRLDAVCDFSSAAWQQSLAFLEPNLSGIGGIHYAPVAETLVMRDVVGEMRRHDPALHLELPRDQRELFVQALLDHADAIGRPLRTLAFVEPKYEQSGPDEQRSLSVFIAAKHGLQVVHADPTELSVAGGEVRYGEAVVDLVYRDYELRDLLALEDEQGVRLDAMWQLFSENRVVSSLGGDFDHKSGWELLTDPLLAERYFSPESRQVFDKHVLWTRTVSRRRTLRWDGRDVALEELLSSEQRDLVLKPNRGYGGSGVLLGAAASREEWTAAVDRALASENDPHEQWVVQRAAPIPVFEFPTLDSAGKRVVEPFFTVMGFAATAHGLGVLVRASQKQVVNVAQRGGIAALLVARAHDDVSLGSQVRTSGSRDALREKVRVLRDLDAAIGLLGWDEETYLPEGGRPQRGEQVATLESLRHKLLLDEELIDAAEDVAATAAGDTALLAEVAQLRRLRRLALALPDTLVRAFAAAKSDALAAWERARTEGRFATFGPALARVVALSRERGAALSSLLPTGAGGDAVYDGLLDEHEPGLTRLTIAPELAALSTRLSALLRRSAALSEARPSVFAGRAWPEAGQQALALHVLGKMGFDFSRGRVDVSSHPFTLAAGSHDVRLTVRYAANDFRAGFFAALHEGGHGLYDQGFPAADATTLLADAPSMGVHESQSRLWENQVGRSLAFWRGLLPAARERLPEGFAGLSAEQVYREVNVVRPSLIRVEADEMSYNLHIAVRTELEIALLSGDLAVDDLPGAWDDAMDRTLGVRPTNPVDGCLQDVHWALGAFGYFPTYTLGNLYAAMLWTRMREEMRDLDARLAAGDLAPVHDWLRRTIHVHGLRHSAAELMRRATGRTLTSEDFLRYLETKYDAFA